MKGRKTSMQADELELGMMVHHPKWFQAPDRVGEIEEIHPSGRVIRLIIEGTATPWALRDDEYVTVVE